MSVNKKNIIKKIVKDASLTNEDAYNVLELFLSSIKKYSRINKVKISGFGSFSYKKTPQRIGRNPKTKDSYIIPELNKLNFMSSNKIKEKLN